MADPIFPTEPYLNAMVHFLDIIKYEDTNYTREERVRNLRYAYSKAAAHFAEPNQQRNIKASPKRLQATLQSCVTLVVYAYAKVSPELMADLGILCTYILLLDDYAFDDPDTTMKSWYNDLLDGQQQEHAWWRSVNGHFPTLLAHFGPFCSMNIVRSTIDFFQGCWIEQRNFLGFPGSYDYPKFMRRMTGNGQCLAAALFPKASFDEKDLFAEITAAIAQVENWEAWVNDLMSFYKEFDEPRDQMSLVNSTIRCHEVTLDDALNRLTQDVIASSEQLVSVFKDKDPRIVDTIHALMQGYVSWHMFDLRYRLNELCDQAGESPPGVRFREYQLAGSEIASVKLEDWAYPSVMEIVKKAAAGGVATPPI